MVLCGSWLSCRWLNDVSLNAIDNIYCLEKIYRDIRNLNRQRTRERVLAGLSCTWKIRKLKLDNFVPPLLVHKHLLIKSRTSLHPCDGKLLEIEILTFNLTQFTMLVICRAAKRTFWSNLDWKSTEECNCILDERQMKIVCKLQRLNINKIFLSLNVDIYIFLLMFWVWSDKISFNDEDMQKAYYFKIMCRTFHFSIVFIDKTTRVDWIILSLFRALYSNFEQSQS